VLINYLGVVGLKVIKLPWGQGRQVLAREIEVESSQGFGDVSVGDAGEAHSPERLGFRVVGASAAVGVGAGDRSGFGQSGFSAGCPKNFQRIGIRFLSENAHEYMPTQPMGPCNDAPQEKLGERERR
jgi:hypothetical protein